jgi:hypothetical protein
MIVKILITISVIIAYSLPGLIAKWKHSEFYDEEFPIFSIITNGFIFWSVLFTIGSIIFLWIKWVIS